MTILLYILLGVLLITVGTTLLTSVTEIISALTELVKANINERIVRHNVTISELNEQKTQTRTIGFTTTTEEDNEYV